MLTTLFAGEYCWIKYKKKSEKKHTWWPAKYKGWNEKKDKAEVEWNDGALTETKCENLVKFWSKKQDGQLNDDEKVRKLIKTDATWKAQVLHRL